MAPKEKSFDGFSLIVALIAVAVSIWSGVEAHMARKEAQGAIEAARRSADAAEKSNTLAARSQSSFLVPKIQKSGQSAIVSVKNVSANVALNVRAGYFLYAGPLKSAQDVSKTISELPLQTVQLALGTQGEAEVIGTPIATSETITTAASLPVVTMNYVQIGFARVPVPQVTTTSQTIQVSIPSHMLVIGLVSFDDSANVGHTATFCFPAANGIDDGECSKLNALQLASSDPKRLGS